jgi:hypothetical protein
MPPGLALPQVKAGKLKAIGLTGGRSTLAPECRRCATPACVTSTWRSGRRWSARPA